MAGENKAKIQREAEKFVLQGKLAQAVTEYQKIIKIDPEDILTLNTVGDICLRMGKPQDASTHFSQVADYYARNNFLQKAIAVYKKILSCDPQNIAVHKTLGSLYAKQGLNVEARNEYLRVAEISSKEGKNSEAQSAYEKVADLDPSNIPAQLKLAEINLREGSKDKAHFYLVAAARAQTKAGDFEKALESFSRALEIEPGDARSMAGMLDAAQRAGMVSRALDVLKRSAASGSENSEVLAMMVRAYLAGGDARNALSTAQRLIDLDASQFSIFFEIQQHFISAKSYDSAATCLDPVLPVVIEKRAGKQAIENYQSILRAVPDHLLSLVKLAELYLGVNDQQHYLETLNGLAEHYFSRRMHREALEVLEKILQITPESEKHLEMHRNCYEKVHPGVPYTPPGKTSEPPIPETPIAPGAPAEPGPAEAGAQPAGASLVEVDLLLNYGMRDKALELLRSLAAKDPMDVGVHVRLLQAYKESDQIAQAAEECLYLALAHRKLGDEEAAQKFIDEAGRLDPAVVASRPELLSLAYQQSGESVPHGNSSLPADSGSAIEVDLSEDISEIFFKDKGAAPAGDESATAAIVGDDMVEKFVPSAAPQRPVTSLSEQLQEVDFYIRLGFYDEARVKLSELEKEHPNNPDLLSRLSQIEGAGPPATPAGAATKSSATETVSEAVTETEDAFIEDFNLIEEPAHAPLETVNVEPPPVASQPPPQAPAVIEAVQETAAPSVTAAVEKAPEVSPPVTVAEEKPPAVAPAPATSSVPPPKEASEPENKGMFAELLDEVNSLTDQEINREEYDTQFSLGIAYREMNLMDEAIKAFQEAMKVLNSEKQPSEVIQCCGMLSTCYLEKGMPRSAIRWCETGLAVASINQHEFMALRYDLGIALAGIGETDKALEQLRTLQEIDPSYRDVKQRIDELRGGSGQHAT